MRARSKVFRCCAAAAGLVMLLVAAGCTDEADPRTDAPARPERWRIDYATSTSDATLGDVTPVSRDEGWALGLLSTKHVLLRRHGGRWQQTTMPIPTSPTLVNLHLAASAPDNVWLLSGLLGHDSNGETTEAAAARRWDGHRWITIPIDFTGIDVAVLAPDDVWVLDSLLSSSRSLTRHWDGHRWTEYVLPHPATSLSASGPRNVWAVGHSDDPTGRTQLQPAAMRFDGAAWRSVPTPEQRSPTPRPHETATLTEVVAVSGDTVWAFGTHDDNPAATDSPGRRTIIVLRWDGSKWRKAPRTPNYTVDVHPFPDLAATGDGKGGFVLAGYQHGASNGTLRVIGYPAPPPATSEAPSPTGQFTVNDLQLVPGTREVWAAGFMGFGASGDTPRGIIASCTLNG